MKLEFKTVSKPSEIPSEKWNSWAWQLQNSLKNEADFSLVFSMSENERSVFEKGSELFNIRTTPYYASLAGASELDPIRRILMPTMQEISPGLQSMKDPLGENKNSPVARIVHRYPDRVLFLVTDICSVYCRFCTRKHFTGKEAAFIKNSEYEMALDYIRSHPGIREVILSGGDPLTLSNKHIEKVLGDLRAIEHVEIIRIGTRMPVVCPMRVDQELVDILKKHKPVFLMTHFNHPRELTLEAKSALDLFIDNGIPVLNQMVLLNGVNNHPAIVQALSRRLLYCRVKPYYMFQCDPSEGTDHLRTSIEDSESIQREMWGVMSGLAMPQLSVDIPDGGGKVGCMPIYEVLRTTQKRIYKGWDGVVAEYKNPPEESILKPLDISVYANEWEMTKNAKVLQVIPQLPNLGIEKSGLEMDLL